jgi:hypothetical protein
MTFILSRGTLDKKLMVLPRGSLWNEMPPKTPTYESLNTPWVAAWQRTMPSH